MQEVKEQKSSYVQHSKETQAWTGQASTEEIEQKVEREDRDRMIYIGRGLYLKIARDF